LPEEAAAERSSRLRQSFLTKRFVVLLGKEPPARAADHRRASAGSTEGSLAIFDISLIIRLLCCAATYHCIKTSLKLMCVFL
jgi:hypothetical protein